ncbi:MAG TPA: hypothetical protein VM265_04240 [Sphingomicrobium sp.]|nr:hypothetical protein [Sphingomicrobium sp.]
MRSNSGRDEGRNNLHDPTLRDRANRNEQTGSDKKGEGKAPSDNRQGRKD